MAKFRLPPQLNSLLQRIDLQRWHALDARKKKMVAAAGAALLAGAVVLASGMPIPGLGGESAHSIDQYPIRDEASFVALAENYHVDPPAAPSLAFDIKLPRGWTVDSAASEIAPDFSRSIIGEIAHIRSPYYGIYRPEVVVQTVELQHDIEAGPWLRHYLLANSYILQGDIDALSTYRAQAAYTYIKENTVMLVQIAVAMNGAEAVLARFEMPLAFKDQMGFIQRRAIETFHLSASNERPAEEQKPFTLADTLKFTYPASWRPTQPDLRDIDRLSLQIVNRSPSGIFNGFIQIFVVARTEQTNFPIEAQRLRAFVKDTLLLKVTEMTDTHELRASDKFVFTRDESYRVASTREGNIAPQDLRLAVLGTEDYYVFVLLLSPEASKDLYNWARNQRALALILASMQ